MSKANTAHFKTVRRELAEELGFDPDNLSALETMRVDVVFGLKSTLDEMRRRLLQGEKIDVTEMRSVADTLERYLPKQPEPESADPRDDGAHERLMAKIDNWIANHETERRERAAERAEMGLPPLPVDLETAQREIEHLREENQALKFWADDAKALSAPESERVITPSESDVVPPGEVPGRNLRTGKQVGPDDHRVRPKPVIDAKAEPTTTVDGKPVRPGSKVPPGNWGTVSGDEAKRRMAAVNNDRSIEHRIMTEPSRVAHEPVPSLNNEPWRFTRGQ